MERSKKIVTLFLCLALASFASANLLTNGDFEQGTTGGLGDIGGGWFNWGGSGWHHNDGPMIGSMGLKFWWDDAGLWQDFAAVGGLDYTFSVEAFNRFSSPCGWNGLIRAEFYDASNTMIADAQLDRFYSGSDPYDQWVTIGGTMTAPENTVSGRIILQIADWYDGVNGDMFFDNASVTVPEPATMAVFGLGLLLIRRKK